MTSTIQVQITGDQEYGRFIKALFVGDPGSGKTLISSTFPNPVFASAEGGLMSIARKKLPFVKIDATEKLLALKAAMEQPPHVRAKLLGVEDRFDRIDTIVIDTIDEVARLLIKERLEANKKEALAIADWGWLGDQMRAIIRSFRNLDMHVVFTCHLKSTEDSETGRIYFKPAIQGAVGDEIAGYVDLALLLRAQPMARVVDGESKRVMVRYLRAMPDPSYPWIKDRSGMLPAEMDINLLDDFDRINELIFGDIDQESEVLTIESSLIDFVAEADTANEDLDVPAGEEVESTPADGLFAEPDSETPVEEPTPPGVDANGEITQFTAAMVRDMKVAEKLKVPAPYPCEVCEVAFDIDDQRDMSVLSKHRKILCSACYRAANKK